VLDKFKERHEHVVHFCDLYVMIDPGDERIRAIHEFVSSGNAWTSAVRGW
jgi:hypothetical protein